MITIDDIAKLANVSKSTVSKALNDRSDVSEKTKQKIIQIANEHNFSPNVFGKSLKSKITNNIGVIFTREKHPLSNNPFFSRILEGIEAELAINGYNLILNILPEKDSPQLPRMILEKQIDGVILIGIFEDGFINKLISQKLPVVQVDPKTDIPDFSQVLIDNEHGGFIATQYLIDMGHKKIGFISGDLNRLSFKQRLDGYLKALKKNNIKRDDNLIFAEGIEEGYRFTKQIVTNKSATAIFSTNDVNAVHGYNAIHDLGLNIPNDISVIGFDDIWSAKLTNPPLTTIRVYKEELGSIGVRTLLNTINGQISKALNTIVPVKLIERQSVKRLA